MPFTLAHPLAVVPLRKKLIFSALIIGSMAPDFPYFLYLPMKVKDFGHSLLGIFLFCLPISLAVLWLFHTLLKDPLVNLFPASQQDRLRRLAGKFRFWPAKRLGMIMLSLLVGIFSHVLWDSFTHYDGFMVTHLPALRQYVINYAGLRIAWHHLLQYGCTALGLVGLAWLYWRWIKTPAITAAHPAPPPPTLSSTFRWMLLAALLVIPSLLAFFSAVRSVSEISTLHSLRLVSAQVVIVGVSTLLVELAIFSLLWKLAARQANRG